MLISEVHAMELKHVHVRIVHDQPIVASGLAILLRQRGDLKVSVQSAATDLDSEGVGPCDIIVADREYAMRMLGGRSTRRGALSPVPRVLVLTSSDRSWDVRMAMESGAHGYVLQTSEPDQLVEAVRAVAAGSRFVARELTPKLADSLSQDSLTARELQVLAAMSTGASNKYISRNLGISSSTVKSHVRSILHKIGAGARTEAVVIAAKRGLPTDRYTAPTSGVGMHASVG